MLQATPVSDFHTAWHPEDYLKQYYVNDTIPADELGIYNLLISYLQTETPHFATALDFGCGPTLHHIIPLIPYTEELHLADYVPANLAAIQQWLRGETRAHNWDVYIKGVLQLEGIVQPSPTDLERRKAQMRYKVRRLKHGNLHWPHPLMDGSTYPLVVSFYCADSATHSKVQWRLFMRHLFNLVAPGGTLLLSALRNSQSYHVGARCFPSAQVTENDMYAVLSDGPFVQKTLDLHVIPVSEWAEEGFESIMVVRAQRQPSIQTPKRANLFTRR
jgi:hypothetical protein